MVELLTAAGAFALAAVVRFWSLGTRPGFDWDEPVYGAIGRSVAQGHGLYAKPTFGVDQAPYLFHPPFYFELLGGWFSVVGEGIPQARTLAALGSLVTLALLYALTRPRWGTWALAPLTIIATDGWLVFTNRVSWIENTMMVFAVAGLVVYAHALRRDRVRLFAAAGLLLGFAAVYKHVGAYVLLAVAVHYALTRGTRHDRAYRRGHVALALAALAVISAYVVGAIAFSFSHGHDAFLADSQVQLERLTGHKASRGSIGGGGIVDALVGPYKIFAVTLALSLLAGLAVVARTIQALRRRTTAVVPDLLLYSWAVAGLLSFAALKLKMGHYFMMVELPLLLYLAAEARPLARQHARAAAAVFAVLLAANFVTFDLRFAGRDDNALAAVATYADQHLPADALVLTEESVGSIIHQPYCKFTKAGDCYADAAYLVTYRSATQRPPSGPILDRLLRYATPLATFKGFKERITVFRSPGTGAVCSGDRLRSVLCRWNPGWIARTAPLRATAAGRGVDVRTGDYRALRRTRHLRPLTPLPSPDMPATVLLGTTKAHDAVFLNVGHATFSGAGRCRPSRRACEVLMLRAGQSAHVAIPTVTGATIDSELKVDTVS
ncbi:MAG TPA: glycosyltransferase family 39 protein [Baekduia sp.]|uniref:ArnT family glycosyltransferase n=1 Tax=Baekduia sp. TaxID=2600305 RepID=UPI002CA3C313|nr:glycosyltransferase family 39 protein [Baekduia sp.]HMJ35383.1 glycosyltransferase family 39 protein [Baekduia sp.]